MTLHLVAGTGGRIGVGGRSRAGGLVRRAGAAVVCISNAGKSVVRGLGEVTYNLANWGEMGHALVEW